MQIERFRKEIYRYCQDNISEEILFTGFAYLWPRQNSDISPKNLAKLTSQILNNLIKEKIIVGVPKEIESVYGMYKILPHKKWVKIILLSQFYHFQLKLYVLIVQLCYVMFLQAGQNDVNFHLTLIVLNKTRMLLQIFWQSI